MAPKPSTPRPKPHTDFWIQGGDLYFRVEQDLFRVHSYFFTRESQEWRDRLVEPGPQGDEVLKVGQNQTAAIVLENEKAGEFARFLWVFYYGIFGDYKEATPNDWKVILRFASKWGFNAVQALAIRRLEERLDIGLVALVQLYQDYDVPKTILFHRYKKLVEQEALLELEDAQALGLGTYVSIQRARELLRGQASVKPPHKSPIPNNKRKDVDEIVASTFNVSLADVKSASGSKANGA